MKAFEHLGLMPNTPSSTPSSSPYFNKRKGAMEAQFQVATSIEGVVLSDGHRHRLNGEQELGDYSR